MNHKIIILTEEIKRFEKQIIAFNYFILIFPHLGHLILSLFNVGGTLIVTPHLQL